MKKRLGTLFSMVIFLAFSAPVFALNLTATINPFWGGGYDGNATSGTARLDIYSDVAFDTGLLDFGTSPAVNYVSSTAAIITPTGWSVAEDAGGLTFQLIGSGGTPITTNHLAFEFDFTLTNSLNQMAALINDGDPSTASQGWKSFFSSNEPWAMNGSIELNGSSASFSTVLTPEPGTVMLLGIGLLGLGFYGRMRRKNS